MPRRIGLPGITWAVRYRDGWTVYTRTSGIVAESLSETAARERVTTELSRFADTFCARLMAMPVRR